MIYPYHVHICLHVWHYICYLICPARAKAIEIQKKKACDALKAKIAREKEEEKQRKIQEAKDKAAALEREKQEAKGMSSVF